RRGSGGRAEAATAAQPPATAPSTLSTGRRRPRGRSGGSLRVRERDRDAGDQSHHQKRQSHHISRGGRKDPQLRTALTCLAPHPPPCRRMPSLSHSIASPPPAPRAVLLGPAAGRGIGAATARIAAQRGYDACVNGRANAAADERTVEDARSAGAHE